MSNAIYTFDEQTVSDLHKDATGCRPSQAFWQVWKASSPDDKQATWNQLCLELDDRQNRRAHMEELAMAKFEHRIATMIGTGAFDREAAVRWILQAEGIALDDFGPPYEELEWELGLPFGYVAKSLKGVH